MFLGFQDLGSTLNEWQDKIFTFTDKITSSPAFPATVTLILFVVSCWAISYFTRK